MQKIHKMNEYYQFCVNPESSNPIMLLNFTIDSYRSEAFIEELYKLDQLNKESIEIYINSQGGEVLGGMGIYTAIQNTKTKVNTTNCGICASISAVVFCAGAEKTMYDYSKLMFHNPFSTQNNYNIETQNTINVFKDSIVKMISGQCKMNEEEVSDMMNKTTWIDSDQAKKLGICTKVEKNVKMNPQKLPIIQNETNLINYFNTLLPNFKSKKSMISVINSLNLREDASEKDVLRAIKEIENSYELKISNKDSEIKKTEAVLVAVQNELATIKNQIETERIANNLEIATNEVLNAIKLGVISETSKDVWIDLIKNDLSKLELLKSFAIVQNAPPIIAKIQNSQNGIKGDRKSSAERLKIAQENNKKV